MMAVWPSHPSRPRPRCASGWPPGHAERWPQLAGITVRWHGEFAYVAGQLPDGTTLPLMRLRYTGSAAHWGFAVYRASHDDYDKSVLPTGYPFGTPQETLDCACGLYLGDPTAWLNPAIPDELTGATTTRQRLASDSSGSGSRASA